MENQWIPVTERLPELNTRCLVHEYDGRIDICNFVFDSYYSPLANNNPLFMNEQDEQPSYLDATHWMYLPDSPI